MYIETATRLQKERDKGGDGVPNVVDQLDFEFVLFASALVDYDYIMTLIARYAQNEPKQQKMSKEQLIGLLRSNANMMEEQEDMIAYINSLEVGKALDEEGIKKGYETFRASKNTTELQTLAQKNGLEPASLQVFVDGVLDRYIFDGEQLTDLLAPLGLGWKERRVAELALMEELTPLLKKMAKGRELSGLEAYDG